MLPHIINWGWIWLDREAIGWPPLAAFVFLLTAAGIIFWYLRVSTSRFTALIAAAYTLSIPGYLFWSTALYADVPLACLTLISAGLLILAMRTGGSSLFLLTGFFAASAAWLKNEGILLGLLLTVILIFFLIPDARIPARSKARRILAYLAGCQPAFWTCVIFKSLSGTQNFMFDSGSLSSFLQLFADGEKLRFITAAFLFFQSRFETWHGLWFLFLAACAGRLIFCKKPAAAPYSEIFAWLVILIQISYMIIFMISPVDIEYHLQTTLTRLLLHFGLLAVCFSFETFGWSGQKPPATIIPGACP